MMPGERDDGDLHAEQIRVICEIREIRVRVLLVMGAWTSHWHDRGTQTVVRYPANAPATRIVFRCTITVSARFRPYPPAMVIATGTPISRHASRTIASRRSSPSNE